MKRFIFLLLIASAQVSFAATFVSSGAVDSIQAIHDTDAHDGDTIIIPSSSTFTWTANLLITKAITLQGGGVGSTIVQNARPVGSNPQSLIRWNMVAGKTSRMTGIEFRETVSHQFDQTGCILLAGINTNGGQMRIDHCKFQSLTSFNIEVHGAIGVIDHNTFAPSGTGIPVYLFHENFNDSGSPQPFGDQSRFSATGFGTNQFMFIEDNTFTWNFASIDGSRGCRWVFRHNNVVGGGWCEAHGIEAATRYGGTRAGEIYNNTFTGSGNINLIANLRSGIFVIHDNTVSGYQQPTVARLVNHRVGQVQNPWGEADGTSPWDVNLAGGPFTSGTVQSFATNVGIANTGTLTVAGTPWSAGQWAGYSVKKTSTVTGMSPAAEIIGSTANTITFGRYGGSQTPDLSFTAGETFAVNKVVHSIDQPGRARGSLIPAVEFPAVPAGWNNQATEACYIWNTTYEGGLNVNFQPDSSTIRSGEHYFNNTPMPGYTPYVYPHPLVSGAPPSPTPTPTPSATPTPTVTPTPTPTPPFFIQLYP